MSNVNALIIAKILINKCHDLGREITNLKLQKLLYFAQGHFMQENQGKFLFYDDFQAWAHGPVVPEVYREYKGYMWFNLPKQIETKNIDSATESFLDRLLNYYGASSGKELEITSHEEAPWKKARNGIGDYEPSTNRIEKSDIVDCYRDEKETLDALIKLQSSN